MNDDTRIGFIGTGVMGAPMCTHLANAGFGLTLHDINRASAEKVKGRNERIAIADTPKAVAEQSDIVITMLPSGKYVRDVALGEEGLIHDLNAVHCCSIPLPRNPG